LDLATLGRAASPSLDEKLRDAIAHHEQGDPPAAETLLRDIVRDEPGYGAAHFCLGCVTLEDGRYAEAREAFLAAVAAEPDHVDARLNLGVAHYRLGEVDAAEEVLTELLRGTPNHPRALHNLGLVRRDKGDVAGALAALWDVVALDPGESASWAAFADAFQHVHFDETSDLAHLTSLLELLLARDDLDHHALAPQVARIFRHDPELTELIVLAEAGRSKEVAAALFDADGISALMRPVVRAALNRAPIPDLGIEALLTQLRRTAIETTVSGRHAVPESLLISMARQCHRNGYLWRYGEDEVAEVEWMVDSMAGRALGEDRHDVGRIALLGCYVPLFEWERAAEVVALASEREDAGLAALVLEQILEPFEEWQLRESIPQLGGITDEVSSAVRAQYEEHPYPRWTNIAREEPGRVAEVLHRVAPAVPAGALQPIKAPRVLVAGCGTGRQVAQAAGRFAGARVTGVDLSSASLAYAARKVRDLTLPDVQLIQGDILELADWDQRFDIIEAVGVLHHMRDPIAGWRALTHLLRPGGLMRIGLYSRTARRRVTQARAWIAERGIPPTEEAIRTVRHEIARHFAGCEGSPTGLRDFYSMPECRDLLFHEMEHHHTLAELSRALDDLGLDFLGFELASAEIRRAFTSRFPEPDAERSLRNWFVFERDHPDSFAAMYQFWVRASA
jgi:SAM-dependent methyltransferase